MSGNPSTGLRQRRQLHFGGAWLGAAAQPQGGHRDRRGPFPLPSLGTQPLSLAPCRAQALLREPGQGRCRSRGSVPGGDAPGCCPVSIPHGSSSQHSSQMELAVSHMEAQPHSGLLVGAAGVCGSTFNPQELPREGHLPTGSGCTQYPLAWSCFPCFGSWNCCTDVANI